MKVKIFRPDGETPIPEDNIAFHKKVKEAFDEIEKEFGPISMDNVSTHAEKANKLFAELQLQYPLFHVEEFTENTLKDLIQKYGGPISFSFEKNQETGEEELIGLVMTHPPGLKEDLYSPKN